MKSNFKLKGLDCANCALELEKTIGKIKGVKEVHINFMTEKMELVYDENFKDEIITKVKKVAKKEEPDIEIEEI